MRALLVVTSALILYGSIYPLTFSTSTYSPERLAQLLQFSLDEGSRGNAIANVLLFIPFGFFSAFASRGGGRASNSQIALLSLAGFVLAYVAQFAQVFIAARVPSGIDVVWNLLGILAGVLAGLYLPGSHRRLPGLEGPLPIPLLLVASWLAYQWIPFVPTLDLDLLRDNVTALLARRTPSAFWVFQNTVLWLVCYQLVERYARGIRHGWYPTATFIVLGMGGLLIGSTVNVDDLFGSACALVLWRVLGGRWYPAALALLLALAIVGASCLPLTLRETPNSFSWIPFSGSLSGSVILNVIAIWKKLVLYGLLVWLLLEARLTLILATAGATALLLLSEWFQVYVQGATPEVTDALLALGIGAAIAARGERPRLADRTRDGGAGGTGGIANHMDWLPAAGVAAVLALAVGILSTLPAGPTAAIRSEVAWAGQRAELIADLRALAPPPGGAPDATGLVASAVEAGCDVLALAVDDSVTASGGKDWRESAAALRRTHPDLVLFQGVGFDTGRDQLNVLLHPDQEAEWVPGLRRAAAAASGGEGGSSRDSERDFLRLVKRIRDAGHPAFLVYSPSSRRAGKPDEGLARLKRWRSLGTRVDAIADATGKQRDTGNDPHPATGTSLNGDDPLISEAGGAWDRHLASGEDIWGALVSSDVHTGPGEEPSCNFSRIHIAAPDHSHAGVMDALDAGTFWADQGRLLDHLLLEVEINGIPRALSPGESADVFTEDGFALARVTLERGPGGLGQPLAVEFVSDCIDGHSRGISHQLSPEQTRVARLIPIQATGNQSNRCIIRARVRLNRQGTEPDLLAYTNYVGMHLRLGVMDGGILDWRLE